MSDEHDEEVDRYKPEESRCDCVVKNRKEGETQLEWFKRWMCQWHWMETDYYQKKLEPETRTWTPENDNPST